MDFVINGKSQADRKVIFEKLNNLQNATYTISITKIRKGRSAGQNGYYWKCIVSTLAEEFGYDRDEMHEILKNKFLSEASVLPNGEMVFYSGSSAKLDTAGFEKYLEEIRRWAQVEFNVRLPEPNEYVETTNSPFQEVDESF